MPSAGILFSQIDAVPRPCGPCALGQLRGAQLPTDRGVTTVTEAVAVLPVAKHETTALDNSLGCLSADVGYYHRGSTPQCSWNSTDTKLQRMQRSLILH